MVQLRGFVRMISKSFTTSTLQTTLKIGCIVRNSIANLPADKGYHVIPDFPLNTLSIKKWKMTFFSIAFVFGAIILGNVAKWLLSVISSPCFITVRIYRFVLLIVN